jgi:hypothetical protein
VLFFEEALVNGYPAVKIKVEDVVRELKGKNLSCWCPIGQPCHADVLLKLANGE